MLSKLLISFDYLCFCALIKKPFLTWHLERCSYARWPGFPRYWEGGGVYDGVSWKEAHLREKWLETFAKLTPSCHLYQAGHTHTKEEWFPLERSHITCGMPWTLQSNRRCPSQLHMMWALAGTSLAEELYDHVCRPQLPRNLFPISPRPALISQVPHLSSCCYLTFWLQVGIQNTGACKT